MGIDDAVPDLAIVGYTDRWNVRAGDEVQFMVSCEEAEYRCDLVRLFHGDESSDGPGYRHVEVEAPINRSYAGRQRTIRSGSRVSVSIPSALLAGSGGLALSLFVQPWRPDEERQVVVDLTSDASHGFRVELAPSGRLELITVSALGDESTIEFPTILDRWGWYFCALSIDDSNGAVDLRVETLQRGGRTLTIEASTAYLGPQRPGTERSDGEGLADGLEMPPSGYWTLTFAGPPDHGATGSFDGKLEQPRLFSRPLSTEELDVVRRGDIPDSAVPQLVGAWAFGLEAGTDRVVDESQHGLHGRTFNLPTRAVTGAGHAGRVTRYSEDPAAYGAIHFHRDDLESAAWPADFEFHVPDDLPSGVYAAWLRCSSGERLLPFFVRPAPHHQRARVALVMSTMTYLVYSNFTDIGKGKWRDGSHEGSALRQPFVDPSAERQSYRYIDRHLLYGPYDRHVDGSGVCYSSLLKPILNMNPKFRYRTLGCPARFAADLYLVDWLNRSGIEVDVLTDHDLHKEGVELLSEYATVLSSTHHEYWTSEMLDGLEEYLDSGGRFMYLGGNSLYGVVSQLPDRVHAVEVRRWGTSWPFEVPPCEREHSSTREMGGTWRNRGRGPASIVGVGTAGAGFDRGSSYRRTEASRHERFDFVFEGVNSDTIGDVPSLQLRWGAAGYEFDRCDQELGSPARTVVLASSDRLNHSHRAMIDDELWFMGGRDGRTVDEPMVPGEPHPFIRSDITYLPYPNGGAVFSVGSIAWTSCLSAMQDDNSVARVTRNVLERFRDAPRGLRPDAVAD